MELEVSLLWCKKSWIMAMKVVKKFTEMSLMKHCINFKSFFERNFISLSMTFLVSLFFEQLDFPWHQEFILKSISEKDGLQTEKKLLGSLSISWVALDHPLSAEDLY